MKSELNVSRLTAYVYTLAYFFAVIFSLTLMYPYAFNKYHTWLINNSKINGKKLTYDGRTNRIYLIYLIGLLIGGAIFSVAAIIGGSTLGIMKANGYSEDGLAQFRKILTKIWGILFSTLFVLLINSRFYSYRSKHTHLLDEEEKESGLRLEMYKIFLSSIIYKAIFLITGFIGYPFALNIRERFYQSRRYVDGFDLKFRGSVLRICYIFFTGIVFLALTIFLYGPYLFFRINRYIIENTEFKNEIDTENIEHEGLKEVN